MHLKVAQGSQFREKVREKLFFFKVREKSGNLHLVREICQFAESQGIWCWNYFFVSQTKNCAITTQYPRDCLDFIYTEAADKKYFLAKSEK